MKFVILNSDYPEFLRWLYARRPGLEKQTYEEERRVQESVVFGTGWRQDDRPLQTNEFSTHAQEKMLDRGASEEEVRAAIRTGNGEPTRKGRILFRKNFAFNSWWRGRHYMVKQVAPVVAEEADRLVVVTVFVYYF